MKIKIIKRLQIPINQSWKILEIGEEISLPTEIINLIPKECYEEIINESASETSPQDDEANPKEEIKSKKWL